MLCFSFLAIARRYNSLTGNKYKKNVEYTTWTLVGSEKRWLFAGLFRWMLLTSGSSRLWPSSSLFSSLSSYLASASAANDGQCSRETEVSFVPYKWQHAVTASARFTCDTNVGLGSWPWLRFSFHFRCLVLPSEEPEKLLLRMYAAKFVAALFDRIIRRLLNSVLTTADRGVARAETHLSGT